MLKALQLGCILGLIISSLFSWGTGYDTPFGKSLIFPYTHDWDTYNQTNNLNFSIFGLLLVIGAPSLLAYLVIFSKTSKAFLYAEIILVSVFMLLVFYITFTAYAFQCFLNPGCVTSIYRIGLGPPLAITSLTFLLIAFIFQVHTKAKINAISPKFFTKVQYIIIPLIPVMVTILVFLLLGINPQQFKRAKHTLQARQYVFLVTHDTAISPLIDIPIEIGQATKAIPPESRRIIEGSLDLEVADAQLALVNLQQAKVPPEMANIHKLLLTAFTKRLEGTKLLRQGLNSKSDLTHKGYDIFIEGTKVLRQAKAEIVKYRE